MKKVFKNFTWFAFLAYAVIFALVSIPIAWLFGEFKNPSFILEKFILGLLVKGITFGVIMSLFFGKKNKTENEN